MKKKLCLLIAILTSLFAFTACNKNDTSQNSGTETENSITETEAQDSNTGEAVSDTIGVWAFGKELVYHASNNIRYTLTEDSNGTVQDKNGKLYSIQECENKIFFIKKSNNGLNIKEGRYDENYLGSKECPDGYKARVINYKKSDLFDLNILEQAIAGEEISITEQATETEITTTEQATETEITTTEQTTETEITTTELVTESETITETTTEPESKSETLAVEENAEYAKIYQDLENFLETDNFKQKDNNNRALELFNHLHNITDSNIEQESIINDTDKNEVRFHCYEKYTITINVEDSEITVTED
ncbi:MAG: hypothetical protein K2G88_06345 [Oscillospiraceae bacterium]|nr:hypothetical protein [Oscillospiraceae bacterium]